MYTYLEVNVQPHVVVPDLDDTVASRGQMTTIGADLHAGHARPMQIGHLLRGKARNNVEAWLQY